MLRRERYEETPLRMVKCEMLQLLAALPKITILVAKQKFFWPSNLLCTRNIQVLSSQLSYCVEKFQRPMQNTSSLELLFPC
jgi:hypothetical protein